MPIPTNIDRASATVITTLPYTTTQVTDFGGTAYQVWYRFTAASDAVVSVFGFGNLSTYQPGLGVYENNDVAAYLGIFDFNSTNVPVYFPVTGGNVYYLTFFDDALATNATLTLSVEYAPTGLVTAGDFLTNIEVDNDAELPGATLRGDQDNSVRNYFQVSPPVAVRGQTGLPHGDQGVIFSNGYAVWADDQYTNVKLYDSVNGMALVATIATSGTSVQTLGQSRVLQRLYVATRTAPAGYVITAYDNTGVATGDTWATTIVSIGHGQFAVNDDETILYYSPGGTSTISRWDLTTNMALSNLVADTAGYSIEDLMVLEDDTILAVFHEEATTPRDVYVKQFSTAGATLHTYSFGDHWRSELNPPRIGFALDSPSSFWIVLKPQPGQFAGQGFQTSIFRNIEISTGSVLTERIHTNFLNGIYIGDPTATPEATMGAEKSYALLVAPVSSGPAYLNGPAALAYFAANGLMRDYRIVRVRRFPHTSDKMQRIFISQLQILVQSGVGDAITNPIVELRISRNGGATFGSWRDMHVGKVGEYLTRCLAYQLGMAREWVFEIRTSDPFFTAWLDAQAELEEGAN